MICTLCRVFLSHRGVKVHLAVMDVVRCVVIAAQEHLEFLAQTEGQIPLSCMEVTLHYITFTTVTGKAIIRTA